MNAKEIKVLIVDDDFSNRLLLKHILADYQTYFASDNNQMWHVLEKNQINLILMDVMMPIEDGFSLARKLKKHDKYMNIPIIFVTAKTEGKDLEEGFEIGAYDYIKKPIDRKELKIRIKSVLKKKENENELERLSTTDSLTGLYNRYYFFENAPKSIEYAKRYDKSLTVAIIDLDNFKTINDCFGHLSGDHILHDFADIIKNNIRPYDIAARYGGDEIVMLFLDTDKQTCLNIIDRIKKISGTKVYHFNDNKVQIFFSFGIAEVSPEKLKELSIKEIINKADENLLKAKKNKSTNIF